MTNTQKENSQEEKCMAVCIFQKCCSSMSGFIFSSTIFFASQGMESISHPFKPWAGLCVCVCACACSVAQLHPTLCDPMDYCPSGSSAMGFSRQEYSCGQRCPAPGDIPDPGIEPTSPGSLALQADFLPLVLPGKPQAGLRGSNKLNAAELLKLC